MTKRTYIDPILAILKGYDQEINRKINECFKNLTRTRECVTYQYQAEPMITKDILFEEMTAEAQIYIDFAKDILLVAEGIQKLVRHLQELDKNNQYKEYSISYPKKEIILGQRLNKDKL